MALSFTPACLPLPRGGAPQLSPQAARAAAPRPIVALAQRGPRDTALATSAAGFPGLVIDAAHRRAIVERLVAERAIDRIGLAFLRADRSAGTPPPDHHAALADQLRQVEPGRPRAIKVELLGPISLALRITDEQERPLAYDPALREAIGQFVALRAQWLHDQIAAAGASPLLCLDEPALDALSSPFCPLDWESGGDLLARTLAAMPGSKGLCIAGPPDWPALLALPVEVVFFDAYEYGASVVQSAAAVADHLGRGGALGWGVVPNDPAALAPERAETLARRFVSTAEYLAAASGVAMERIGALALISTSGDLGHLPPEQAGQIAALCREVSAVARVMFKIDGEPRPEKEQR
ncbi:MAG: hypothetical protein OHK0015_43740 [Chloroflexi bacterium OHK40]